MDETTRRSLQERYLKAAHAMQSGVAYSMGHTVETTPKHLRVGVNSAMVETSTLARLLIANGVFTEQEHLEMLCVVMEEEVASYQKKINERLGVEGTITLA